jgi:hypothetical protein
MELLGIIRVGFNIEDQLLLIFFIRQILAKKWEYNILIQSGITMKLDSF